MGPFPLIFSAESHRQVGNQHHHQWEPYKSACDEYAFGSIDQWIQLKMGHCKRDYQPWDQIHLKSRVWEWGFWDVSCRFCGCATLLSASIYASTFFAKMILEVGRQLQFQENMTKLSITGLRVGLTVNEKIKKLCIIQKWFQLRSVEKPLLKTVL